MPIPRYEPALDGLRAVAVLGVLVFHVAPGRLQGGFTGVDVFFVLSGYLITSIIVHAIDSRSFSLREFYVRRVLRLMPNLVAMVACVVCAWLALRPASDALETAHHAIWTLLSGSNFYIYLNLGGYWGDGAKTAALTHAWSLGIEEQFYLLFPLAVLGVARLRRTALEPALAAATLASAAACIALTPEAPDLVFYMAPFRAWELLAGGLLALRIRAATGAAKRASRGLPGMVGLAAIAGCFMLIQSGSGFPGWIAAVPCAATCLVIWSIQDCDSMARRILSSSIMVGIGRRSYSIYLWHWPIITLAKRLAVDAGQDTRVAAVLGGLLSVLVALAAYRFIEEPLRRDGLPRGSRLAGLAAGFLATCGLALAIIASVHPVADPHRIFDRPVSYGQFFNAGTGAPPAMFRSSRYYDVEFPIGDFSGKQAWRKGGIVRSHGPGDPKVAVIGSSHALMFSGLIDRLCIERRLAVAFLGVDGAPALFQQDMGKFLGGRAEGAEFNEVRRNFLRSWKPAVVFCIDRWELRMQDPDRFERDLRDLVDEVRSWGGKVAFVTQVPPLEVPESTNLRELACRAIERDGELPELRPAAGQAARMAARRIAERVSSADSTLVVIPTEEAFMLADGNIRYADDRKFLYVDNDHLTEDGADRLRDLFLSVTP